MKILAIDLGGALVRSRPFKIAHVRWFEFFSKLTGKDFTHYADKENYFEGVHEVMKEYLGDIDEKLKVMFAREVYSMMVLSEFKDNDLVKGFSDYLRSIKEKYKLALVTTAPEEVVDAILERLGVADLFNIVYKSPMQEEPDKKKMLQKFISKYGKPEFYIGDGDKHIEICKEFGIKTISVNWVNKAEIKGDFDIESVKELEEIIK